MFDVVLPPPPRDSGWESDDLDMYDLPDHVELIYGALELMMSPQRSWHHQIIRRLANMLEDAAYPDWRVEQEMTIRIDRKSRPEPDLLMVAPEPDYNSATKWFRPEDVVLVMEVESPESEARDRELKPMMYARAGIGVYVRVSEGPDAVPVIHRYHLENGKYRLIDEYQGRLVLDKPIQIDSKIRPTW
ncbi:Uma2 family endonuclease [Glycomyces tenuis]|uniref:Uma2 family endonuclease n=1 Tax=Glycomyces tenuis TaxID=58116 RepID=UPI00040EEE3A|nr:Uma2 family endonuclease [Glycomyces tenuis]